MNPVIATTFLLGIMAFQVALIMPMLGWNPLMEGHAEYHERFYWNDGQSHSGIVVPMEEVKGECHMPVYHGLRCVIEDLNEKTPTRTHI